MRIPLRVEVLDKDLSSHKPAAVNWAYSSSHPIWEQPREVLADLVAHGVDVFVVPPHHIPLPDLDGRWDVKRAVKLREDIELFRPYARQVLLVLGWHPGRKPEWLGPDSEVPDARQREVVMGWAQQLKTFMDSIGLPADKWILYPVDEPFGEKKVALKRYIRLIKDAVPEFRIYANPTAAEKGRMSVEELRQLGPEVNVWQPTFNFASTEARGFFENLDRDWWTYRNPEPPAKTAEPWFYRMISWQAWALGASGVGFWSYSDTQNSST